MHVFLTGATGYIGSGIARRLAQQGHTVTALVRSETSKAAVEATGASAAWGEVTDIPWLTEQLAGTAAAVHAASPGDATSPEVDAAVAAAAVAAFAGTDRPYVHTGGAWAYGNNTDITEDDPYNAPPLMAWREQVEETVLSAGGLRGMVVVPGLVFGNAAGIPNLLTGATRTSVGALTLVGGGDQHWATVHVDDLADLYVRALEKGRTGYRYVGSDGHNPTVRELGEAASRGSGEGGEVAPEPDDATRERLGAAFADCLLLDQRAGSGRARTELGWTPSRPSLVQELEHGSYSKNS